MIENKIYQFPFRAETTEGEMVNFYGLYIFNIPSQTLVLHAKRTKDFKVLNEIGENNGVILEAWELVDWRKDLMRRLQKNIKNNLSIGQYESMIEYDSEISVWLEADNPELSDPFEAFNNSIPKVTYSEGLAEELVNLEITTIPPESITKIVFPKMSPLESIEIGNGFLPEEEPEDIMNMKMVDFVEMTNYIVAIATGEPHCVEARIAEMAKKISVKELVEIGDKFRVLETEEPDADCEAPEAAEERETQRIMQGAKLSDLEIEILNMPKKKVKKDDVFKLIHRAYEIGKGEF